MPNVKDFLLPDLGEGLTEGEIVSWLVDVGDAIEEDQPVAEVETAKAVVEVPSPFSGTVTTLHAEVGEEVEVGKPLLSVDVDGGGGAGEPTPASEERGTAPDEAEVAEMVPEPAEGEDADDDSGNVLVGYGTGGRARARRRRGGDGGAPTAPPAGAPPPGPPSGTGRPLAKPPVRKLAKDLGIDLAEVRGSGPDGKITRDDVHAAAAPEPEPEPEVALQPSPTGQREEAEVVPLRGVRKAIAEKMTLSRREIPDATTWVDCDATALWELRQQLNADQPDVKVSPLAIILRACVAGLREYPDLNASLDVERAEIRRHRHVNLGFAAQTDRGLVVPVIKDAHRRSTIGIAQELNRLAKAARDGKVTPEEMGGGTFTVSNYGSFKVDGGSAVINHPEAAILGVGQIAERPWVVDGQLAVRMVLQLSIAFDHRICDGGEAAGFLRFIADCVERPTKLLGAL